MKPNAFWVPTATSPSVIVTATCLPSLTRERDRERFDRKWQKDDQESTLRYVEESKSRAQLLRSGIDNDAGAHDAPSIFIHTESSGPVSHSANHMNVKPDTTRSCNTTNYTCVLDGS